MNASPARILPNQAHAPQSTGPNKTPEGKAQSRRNAIKHGLTGAGIALPNEDAAEVDRRTEALRSDFKPSGEFGETLVRRMALHSVRMDRCVSHETASLSGRMRQVEADFVAPEGVSGDLATQLKAEAVALAMFDPSHEATLARKYEAAAERGFFRALKELRQVEKTIKVANPAEAARASIKSLGSFLPVEKMMSIVDSLPAPAPRKAPIGPAKPTRQVDFASVGDFFDVPIAIGRAR